MSDYSLVLSDDLLKVYFEFKQGNIESTDVLEKFLSYYHAPFLTCIDQLKRIGVKDDAIEQQLASQGYINQSVGDLVPLTRYKLILNITNDTYPYVNIHKDRVEKNFSLTFKRGENRDKAIELITALCANARFVFIFDKFFCENWRRTKSLFDTVLPKKSMTILHVGHLSNKASNIKGICSDWKVKQDSKNTYTGCHDRYLLIDNKVEIILTSGFDYLFETSKDLTCVIRSIESN